VILNIKPISGWVFYLTRVKKYKNYLCVIFIDMEIKISDEKLDYLKDVIVDSLGIDKRDSFQPRSSHLPYIEFLTPGTREYVISRYYFDINLVVVNDERLYDLISKFVGSYKVYDLIKNDIIKQIYRFYTERFKARDFGDIRNLKYMSNMDFNKK